MPRNRTGAVFPEIVAHCVRPGDRVRHLDYGNATVIRVRRDGGVVIKLDDDGIEGTCDVLSLRKPMERKT